MLPFHFIYHISFSWLGFYNYHHTIILCYGIWLSVLIQYNDIVPNRKPLSFISRKILIFCMRFIWLWSNGAKWHQAINIPRQFNCFFCYSDAQKQRHLRQTRRHPLQPTRWRRCFEAVPLHQTGWNGGFGHTPRSSLPGWGNRPLCLCVRDGRCRAFEFVGGLCVWRSSTRHTYVHRIPYVAN